MLVGTVKGSSLRVVGGGGGGERERESCPVLPTLTVVVRDPSRVGCVVMFVHGKNV